MKVDLLEIINLIMIFQLLVFTAFLWGKKGQHVSNYIFGLHLFSQAAGIFQVLGALQKDFLYMGNPHISFIGYPFVFLWGPTFYFYVKSIVYKNMKFKWTQIVHLIPFLAILLYFALTFYFNSEGTKKLLINDSTYFFNAYHVVIDLSLRLQIIFYIVYAYVILFKVRRTVKENYSSVAELNLSWLTFVIIGYSICYAISVAFIYLEFYLVHFDRLLYLGNFFQFFIYFNIIFFKAWNRPEIFKSIRENEKYKNSKLTKNEAEIWISKLEEQIQNKKPYLNPALTLDELAKEIDVHPRILSQLINEYYKQNFFDLINHLRIEEAKRILLDPSNKKNILEILYSTGFNSKATFNRAFKKDTGFTPTDYKKRFSE